MMVGRGDAPRMGLPTPWFIEDLGEGPGDFFGDPPRGEDGEGRGGSHIDEVEKSLYQPITKLLRSNSSSKICTTPMKTFLSIRP